MIGSKWPLLLVVGESVTEEQASEILIRTNHWQSLHANDKRWLVQVQQVTADFGYPVEPEHVHGGDADDRLAVLKAQWEAMDDWCVKVGVLELEYLLNDRVMSSWIGGPHGWCDWSGRIGTSNYNIGKWPTTEEVTEEWRSIAEAFPYLTLTAQCIEDEGAGRLCGEWRVHNGTVRYIDEPTERIAAQEHLPIGQVLRSVLMPGGERGVSLERLRAAFEVVCR